MKDKGLTKVALAEEGVMGDEAEATERPSGCRIGCISKAAHHRFRRRRPPGRTDESQGSGCTQRQDQPAHTSKVS
jgi:hypothetical protein